MGGFFDDVFDGIKSAGSAVYGSVLKPAGERAWGMGQSMLNRFDKIQGIGDNVITAGGQLVQGAGNAAEGIGNFLGGNSNILLYVALIAGAAIVLPRILDRI